MAPTGKRPHADSPNDITSDHQNIELAWAAGFFDGEGCVRWRNKWTGNFIVSIAQVHREPLDRFKSAVSGGNDVTGPYHYPDKRGPRQPYYQYTASSYSAESIFHKIRPYLSSIKRGEGDDALRKFHEGKQSALGGYLFGDAA